MTMAMGSLLCLSAFIMLLRVLIMFLTGVMTKFIWWFVNESVFNLIVPVVIYCCSLVCITNNLKSSGGRTG